MKNFLLTLLAVAVACPMVSAQDNESKLTITPAGRILADGAVYSPTTANFNDGVSLPDIRMGLKATYGKWTGKIDIGYAMGKVGLKDILIQYDLNKENYFKLGSFIQQYGLQTATSSSMKCNFITPMSDDAFNASRQIGLMYAHVNKQWFNTVSVHAEPQASVFTPYQLNEQGWGVVTRQVWRPLTEPGRIFQVGISAGYTSPQKTDGDVKGFTMTANFPTRVNSEKAVYARIDDARYMVKFTPEIAAAVGPIAFQGQYYYNRVNLKHDLHNFTGQGFYFNVRGLILGGNYKYSSADADIANPAPKSLELTAGYNYTCLSDKHAQQRSADGTVVTGIHGGRANVFGTTLTYYINKYVLCRLNYAYVYRWDRAGSDDMHINIVQARLQIKF